LGSAFPHALKPHRELGSRAPRPECDLRAAAWMVWLGGRVDAGRSLHRRRDVAARSTMTSLLPLAPTRSPALKPPAEPDALEHLRLTEGPFWQRIPAYAGIPEEQFLDHHWQSKHSITNPEKLLAAVRGLVPESFVRDAEAGFHRAPMSVRV